MHEYNEEYRRRGRSDDHHDHDHDHENHDDEHMSAEQPETQVSRQDQNRLALVPEAEAPRILAAPKHSISEAAHQFYVC